LKPKLLAADTRLWFGTNARLAVRAEGIREIYRGSGERWFACRLKI
jgi:hypothetical protein